MRTTLALCLLLPTIAWAHDPNAPSQGRTRDDLASRTLTSEQVAHYSGAYLPAVRACYVGNAATARRATGELELRIVVDRGGHVSQLDVEAPGVTGWRLRDLDACLRDEVMTWRFPLRRQSTTARVPYYFQQLRVPSAGPYLSCWKPKGCPRV